MYEKRSDIKWIYVYISFKKKIKETISRLKRIKGARKTFYFLSANAYSVQSAHLLSAIEKS